MKIPWRDKPFVHWAQQNGLSYYYTHETGMPGGALKMHMGLVTAYIQQGKLVRLLADSKGDLLDELMHQLSNLFAQCARLDAYEDQSIRYMDPSPTYGN